jgi:hypothetical protein
VTLFRTLVRVLYEIEQQDGLLDTISWENGLWLVYKWTAAPTEGFRTPVRAIRVDTLRYRKLPLGQIGDFELLDPIPIGVLDRTASLEEMRGYVVKVGLPLEIPIPKKN